MHRRSGDAQVFSCFFQCEAAEDAQFGHLCLPHVERSQAVQHLVHIGKSQEYRGDRLRRVSQAKDGHLAPALVGAPLFFVRAQDAPHHLRCHSQQVSAVGEVHAVLIDQAQISFVHQRSGLQRVALALVAHVGRGQAVQLIVNLRKHRIERNLLAGAGIAPEDIDVVINTHLHFDHCGWNTMRGKDGRIAPTFPRAKYYAPEGEWQYARQPSERDSISYISDNYDPLVASGQMTLLKGGEEIVPGISVQTFPGHTASMQGVIVNGRGEAVTIGKGTTSVVPSGEREQNRASAPAVACYISDLIPTTRHIEISWGMGFDLYPLETIESKKLYYAKSIPEKWLTVFTHDHETPWAFVEKDEAGKMVVRGV